jgi:Asp-tRNA(Asn)/Glu-tRNA(Gln) amidotransferase A subunit family amidase
MNDIVFLPARKLARLLRSRKLFLERLLAAGAITPGKSDTPEFAPGAVTFDTRGALA